MDSVARLTSSRLACGLRLIFDEMSAENGYAQRQAVIPTFIEGEVLPQNYRPIGQKELRLPLAASLKDFCAETAVCL